MDAFKFIKFTDIATPYVAGVTPRCFGYYGKRCNQVSEFMVKFINENVKGDIDGIIAKMQDFMRLCASMDAYWIAIRITDGVEEFNIPRWHTDGIFYTSESGYKIAAVIVGSGTLFIKETNEVANIMSRKLNRPELANALSSETVYTPDEYSAAIFTTGRINPAIHSEPQHVGPRIFLSALPGTEDQIRELASDRNAEYFRG